MKTTSAILALASAVSAHVVMTNPKPFATNNGNGPLAENGANYPCAASSFDGVPTEWKAGESKMVTFMGGATHSGGSCQFSITPDTKPSKQSQFKVVHSVIGGCLSEIKGNAKEDPNYTGSPGVNVKIPDDLPAGKYTFAWSWLNRSGNREFYMNCAPITVTSSSKKSVADSIGGLPDMFVANMPPALKGGCSTTEGEDFNYPNPGKSVQKMPVLAPNYGNTLTGPQCPTMTKWGAGNGQLGSPGSTPTKPEPSAAPTKPVSPPTNSGIVGAPTPTPKPQPETPPPAAGSVPCTNNGGLVCIGSSQFGICNNGAAVPQALAAGTKCQGGAIVRRSVRAPRRHLARSHASNLI